ncbi:DUF5777 family beta-barrel protein [Fulvivirga sediminis]|nr:DUF5777 family beta-barrel protein [Fulvivirga sediminis]
MKGYSQDDLLSDLEAEQPEGPQIVTSTFKGTRLINGHSVETRKEGTLEFMISHRFGTLNSGSYNFWGLDQASIRIALEYAVFDRFMIGVGRSSYQKTYDGYLKYKLLQQQKGSVNMPISVVLFSSLAIKTLKRTDDFPVTFDDKLASTYQMLIARKFSDRLSLQVSPTFVQYGLIEANETRGDVLAIGVGGRLKLTNRLAINAEYFPQLRDKGDQFQNAFAIGVDIETGGHVFQLQFTNATSMIEKGFVGESTNDFFDGDIHFGFNISRAFQLK